MAAIQIGMNGRFFPGNWRPALQEIEFAGRHQFQSLQFSGRDNGLSESDLDAPFADVAAALREYQITPVMEIVVRVAPHGHTMAGKTPLEVLEANLPAITELGCTCVHWHLGHVAAVPAATNAMLEESLYPQFAAGVALAQAEHFKFGFEHNEPELLLFGSPEGCTAALNAVPGLHFVWDFNHTTPAHLSRFTALIPRMSMLHVSDAPLPDVNHHLPLGLGTIDYAAYCRQLLALGFEGAGILEIGGIPKSGGFGRDTDDALIDSAQKLKAAVEESTSSP
jgi:sugar phosphate isomerase/epimerase